MLKHILTVCCVAFGAHAAVITVGPDGDYVTIQNAVDHAGPGDVVEIAGGRYHETVQVNFSGEEGRPITIRAAAGDSVIMQGWLPLVGWNAVASSDDVAGNPNWASIHKVSTPSGIPWSVINVYEGETLLRPGQYPEPADVFFDRRQDEFMDTPQAGYTTNTIIDPGYFTQAEDDFWNGAWVYLHAPANAVYAKKVLDYNGSEKKITFEALSSVSSGDAYAMANHPSLITGPGQYYYDDINRELYLWPHDEAHLEDSSITVNKRTWAFYISGKAYIDIENITMKRYNNNVVYVRGGSAHINVRKCIITQGASTGGAAVFVHGSSDVMVYDCEVSYHKNGKGVVYQAGHDNVLVDCYLRKNGGTCVDFYGETESAMIGNTVLENLAVHANGLTLYDNNRDCLVQGNFVADGNAALTYHTLNGLTVVNNVFLGNGHWATCCWANSTTSNVKFFHNTVIGEGAEAFYSQGGTINGLEVRNNIIDGVPDSRKTGTWSHNLYVNPAYNSTGLQTGEIRETDKDAVFVDYAGRDFRLAAGSPAIDAGTDVGVEQDIAGLYRSYNGTPDMGAHEFGSYVSIRTRAPETAGAVPEVRLFSSHPVRVAGAVTFTVTGGAEVRSVSVSDAAGRTVHQFGVAAGRTVYAWDGNGNDGTPVAAGTYLVAVDGRPVKTISIVY